MKRFGHLVVFIVVMLSYFLPSAGAQTQMTDATIGIQYVGPSDKPITPIVIALSDEDAELFKKAILKRSGLELTDVHVVSPSLMAELIAAIEKNRGGTYGANKGSQFSDVVLLTISIRSQAIAIHLNRNDGIDTLTRLGRLSKSSAGLESDILHFKTRISSE